MWLLSLGLHPGKAAATASDALSGSGPGGGMLSCYLIFFFSPLLSQNFSQSLKKQNRAPWEQAKEGDALLCLCSKAFCLLVLHLWEQPVPRVRLLWDPCAKRAARGREEVWGRCSRCLPGAFSQPRLNPGQRWKGKNCTSFITEVS